MKRRFPGVDPYLEDPAFWRDFHESFIIYLRDAMTARIPDSYDVRVDERVTLSSPEEETQTHFLPDVAVSWERPSGGWDTAGGGTALLEPVTVPLLLADDEERTSFLEILHRPTQKLVTVIELLSPTNKTSPGFHDYLHKRKAILREPVHLVEFDFLAGGRRMPTRRPLPPGDCYALVSRFTTRPNAEVYAWTLRDRIPAIRVPLRDPDPDLLLDLAAVYEETFTRGRYQRNLRYDAPPPVPLNPAAAEWMASLS